MSYSTGYVSVIFPHYMEPIAYLVEKLKSLATGVSNEVQTGSEENGYSISIIVLTVLMLESALNRTKYIQKNKTKDSVAIFFSKEFPQSGFADKLEELFVVRDAIAHNHLWEGQVYWDAQLNLKAGPRNIVPGYGDKKFRKVVNISKGTTHQLHINVIPVKIDRTDAINVLKTVIQILLFLESQDRNYVYISHMEILLNKKHVNFIEFINTL